MARILVVDDDPDFVEILRWVLQTHGYQVETAPDGDTALRLAQSSPPDLMVLDVMMSSVLDGVHVAHELSEHLDLPHRIPVIMVSSIADSDMAAMFPTDEYLPIDGWLSKPVQPERLLEIVSRLLPAA